MSHPSREAQLLLEELGWSAPGDLTVEEMAYACGLMIQRKEMEGSDGHILMNGSMGIINVNVAISYQPKINYVIAHEIGHARLHRQLSFFADNKKTLNEWYAKGPQEKEANEFAAELLMPEALFKKKVSKEKLSVKLIESVATYFGTSKTATFLRYREHGEYPVMVIFVENGVIKWKQPSDDFPYKWLSLDTRLPSYTVAGDHYYRQVLEPVPEKVDAIEWFPEDYTAQREPHRKLWEQCFPVGENSLVTCIWTP
ncbi:ImmA/IrrE family metallo-endopeptidase [Chitinophaga sp. Ak27]|uniref:ImmA/IrrE family metallo-endopeptidase n=1 Tax=Chitinophaga sp. Ak27 TaxID=2726116 RepID=UPI00145C8C93|nr:ImmA/IrrE family metallo-endopeptidase [Chitinophaga sp. Ak27]NLU92650.1 ImmA/IrrE family metallo-endopeptidase [Chitinophaga sp. Ak27]